MISSPPQLDAIARRLQTVQHLITSGKLSEAAERLNGVAKSAPRDPRVHLLGMRLGEAAGNPAAAQTSARKAVELAPEWPVGVTELAFLLARQNQFQDAMEFARRAVKLDGDNPEVLGRVIDIAHRAQHLDLAIQWLERALDHAPGNQHLRHQLARDLRLKDRHGEAIAAYDALLAVSPSDQGALLGRLQTALASGNAELARKDAETLLALAPDSDESRYWHTLAHGQTPSRQPVAIVRSLYDGMAELYDQHIVAGLKYKLPREVARQIKALYPDNKLNLLDLGSGTGLLGACLAPITGAMIGVELSPRMSEQAARHGVYHRFHQVDLRDALHETPGSLYDVIAALDVFIYVGELDTVIPDALRVLVPGGHFIFSCEAAGPAESDLVLRATQRYAHKASSIEASCRAAGFTQVAIETMPLRYEGTEPVQGFLVTARKAA